MKASKLPLSTFTEEALLTSVEDLRCFCGQRKVFVLFPSPDPLSSVITSTYPPLESRFTITNQPSLKRHFTNRRLKLHLPCSSRFRISNLQSLGVSDAIDPPITDIKLCQHPGRGNPKPNTTTKTGRATSIKHKQFYCSRHNDAN